MFSFYRQLIKQNADRERNSKKGQEMAEVIIGNRVEAPETPRLVHTVMQASQKSTCDLHVSCHMVFFE
jgi:hypothetical protein